MSDDTGVIDLDIMNDPTDDAVALIEVPVRQAFSYFAERENDIAKFYVQRYGEYKIAGDNLDEETDVEKYHRLASEVNQLLNKFQSDKKGSSERQGMSLDNSALTHNLEILAKQLKSLEFAAEEGSLNPTQSDFLGIQSKLNKLQQKVSSESGQAVAVDPSSIADEAVKSIRLSALERRLNLLETLLGNNDEKTQSLFKSTNSESLIDAADALASWSSFCKPDNLQRVGRELEYLSQRIEKISEQATKSDESKQLDPPARAKLDHLYNLVTSNDKYRAKVPAVIHRLNAMEELQRKSAQVATTVSHLEQLQSQISENLHANKSELTSLTESFAKNIDLIKEFSKDIDGRIAAIREHNQ